jgi:hypothetical protein
MKQYKLRAECIHDIIILMNVLDRTRIINMFIIPSSYGLPDCQFEINCEYSIEELKRCIKKVPDGHVMHETVTTLKEYTGVRAH